MGREIWLYSGKSSVVASSGKNMIYIMSPRWVDRPESSNANQSVRLKMKSQPRHKQVCRKYLLKRLKALGCRFLQVVTEKQPCHIHHKMKYWFFITVITHTHHHNHNVDDFNQLCIHYSKTICTFLIASPMISMATKAPSTTAEFVPHSLVRSSLFSLPSL